MDATSNCLIKVSTGFANATQVGTIGMLLPNDNVYFMTTAADWADANTALDSEKFTQLNLASFGAVPVKQGGTQNLLVLNPTAKAQEIILTFQNAMSSTVSATAVLMASVYMLA